MPRTLGLDLELVPGLDLLLDDMHFSILLLVLNKLLLLGKLSQQDQLNQWLLLKPLPLHLRDHFLVEGQQLKDLDMDLYLREVMALK